MKVKIVYSLCIKTKMKTLHKQKPWELKMKKPKKEFPFPQLLFPDMEIGCEKECGNGDQ